MSCWMVRAVTISLGVASRLTRIWLRAYKIFEVLINTSVDRWRVYFDSCCRRNGLAGVFIVDKMVATVWIKSVVVVLSLYTHS